MQHIHIYLLLCFWGLSASLKSQDAYELWLGYRPVENAALQAAYSRQLQHIYIAAEDSPILQNVRKEFQTALPKLLGLPAQFNQATAEQSGLILATRSGATAVLKELIDEKLPPENPEAYCLYPLKKGKKTQLLLLANNEQGLLYGSFHLLRLLQQHAPIDHFNLCEQAQLKHRILNQWDNLDGTVERGYAGFSIWDWHQLPDYLDPRYADFARANASIGINGVVITNVNAKAIVFRPDYLEKAAALANIFRTYGIRFYLTARFSAPMELGGLSTADPLDPAVQAWWKAKVAEIYTHIPDFGGFLVKANSEGQPGPQDYGRNHAQGANMLAKAVQAYGGIVMWRAFVYSEEEPEDRAKQAFNEFVPLDGQFEKNVLIQVKNGPIDFQPREPIHPLFGAMPQTPLMVEFQITKEYLGQGTHTVGLANMYEEVLQTDTYSQGPGSTVARIISGTLDDHSLSGIAGVANIGTAANWTGNLFGQADWYAFGRLAWNPNYKAKALFKEWSIATFGHQPKVLAVSQALLERSYEACVQYMTPLGLHHIMGPDHHYGPGPWISDMPRADWTSTYYHKADSIGIGFNRTPSGSHATAQYTKTLARQYEDPSTCPESLLLWFHHLPWTHRLQNGQTLWEKICLSYQAGVDEIIALQQQWAGIEGLIDEARFQQQAMHLQIQVKEAKWWRDACLSYFQSFSKLPLPEGVEKPAHDLDYYKRLQFPYAPGIRPSW